MRLTTLWAVASLINLIIALAWMKVNGYFQLKLDFGEMVLDISSDRERGRYGAEYDKRSFETGAADAWDEADRVGG